MTISLRADPSGTSGAIQVNGVDRVTIDANGISSGLANGIVSFSKLLSTDWTSSLAASGYQKLPSGLIIQWGLVSSTTSIQGKTFPIAFPNAAFSVNVSPVSTVSTTIANASGLTTSGFNIISSAAVNAWFLAIGY